jgi:hypothetical protein
MDRDVLLAAVDKLTADAVIHQLTALKKPPVRHRDMAQTNALRTSGTANLLELGSSAPAASSPSRWSSGTATETTARSGSPRTSTSGRQAMAGSSSIWPPCASRGANLDD